MNKINLSSKVKNYIKIIIIKVFFMEKTETLRVKIDYDESKGISVVDFSNYLINFTKEYENFARGNSTLSIKAVDKGSIIIDFTQSIIVPVLTQVMAIGIIDFGSYVINSIKKVRQEKQDIIKGVNDKDKNSLRVAKTFNNVIPDSNSNITNIVIGDIKNTFNISYKTEDYKEDKEDIKKALEKVKDIEVPIPPITYESAKLEFKTVTRRNEKGTYSGWVKSINKHPKKIIFCNDDIKNTFSFDEEPFKKVYLVDVKVHYNKDSTIAKYEIIENMGTINKEDELV